MCVVGGVAEASAARRHQGGTSSGCACCALGVCTAAGGSQHWVWPPHLTCSCCPPACRWPRRTPPPARQSTTCLTPSTGCSTTASTTMPGQATASQSQVGAQQHSSHGVYPCVMQSPNCPGCLLRPMRPGATRCRHSCAPSHPQPSALHMSSQLGLPMLARGSQDHSCISTQACGCTHSAVLTDLR
jgi:hypothetical protein